MNNKYLWLSAFLLVIIIFVSIKIGTTWGKQEAPAEVCTVMPTSPSPTATPAKCGLFTYQSPWRAVEVTDESCLLVARSGEQRGVAWVGLPMQVSILSLVEDMQDRQTYRPVIGQQEWHCEVMNLHTVCVTVGAEEVRLAIDVPLRP